MTVRLCILGSYFLDKLKGETEKRVIYLPYKIFWKKMNDNDIETFREIQASVLDVPIEDRSVLKVRFISMVAQKNQWGWSFLENREKLINEALAR